MAFLYKHEGFASKLDDLLKRLEGTPELDEVMKKLEEADHDSLVYESDLDQPK